MKNIDRFWKVMDCADFDHPPFFMENVWRDTELRWNAEGLPKGESWHQHLGITPLDYAWHGFNHGPFPEFPHRTVEETPEYRIFIDGSGRTVKDFKNQTAMPQWLNFTVKDRASFEQAINERFAVVFEERIVGNWEERKKQLNDPNLDALVLPPAGNYFFTLDSMMGVETVSFMLYESPDLMHRYFDNVCEMCCWFMEKILTEVKGIRAFGTGEDLSFKNGPFFSPQTFEEFFMPRFKRIKEICARHGCDLGFMDSDGNFQLLIPQLLECGINLYCPVEVAAGMDPVQIRRDFGKSVRMLGGVDKRIVAEGKDAIRKEMERLFPVMAEGGFVPIIDHSVPSTISWDNFRYYIDTLREMHGRCERR